MSRLCAIASWPLDSAFRSTRPVLRFYAHGHAHRTSSVTPPSGQPLWRITCSSGVRRRSRKQRTARSGSDPRCCRSDRAVERRAQMMPRISFVARRSRLPFTPAGMTTSVAPLIPSSDDGSPDSALGSAGCRRSWACWPPWPGLGVDPQRAPSPSPLQLGGRGRWCGGPTTPAVGSDRCKTPRAVARPISVAARPRGSLPGLAGRLERTDRRPPARTHVSGATGEEPWRRAPPFRAIHASLWCWARFARNSLDEPVRGDVTPPACAAAWLVAAKGEELL